MATFKLPAPSNIESPAHRADLVIKHYTATGTLKTDWPCSSMVEFNKLLCGVPCQENIEDAYRLYYIPSCRASINSLLISRCPSYEIASAIEEQEETINVYSRLFFDTSVFSNKLVTMAYIRQMPSNTQQEEFEKSLMISAIQLGHEYILWKLGVSVNVSEATRSEMYTSILIDSYWKFKELKSKNNSELTKEARAWIPAILSVATTSDKLDYGKPTSGSESLALKLISVATTTKITDITEDIKG
jgi:hypothetical protein